MTPQTEQPTVTTGTPIQHSLLIQTRDLPHFLKFASHDYQPDFYRTSGEFMLASNLKVISHAPGTGGDGPGPDLTGVELEVNGSRSLYWLGRYWGQRELRLRQLEGQPDNMLLAWQKDGIGV